MSIEKRISRRQLLRKVAALGAGLAFAGPVLAACGPTPTPQVIKEVVKETVVVKEVVEKPVEKVVTKVVEKEVTVAPKARPTVKIRYTTFWPGYRVTVLKQALKVFAEQKPYIQVEVEPLPSGEYRQKLTVQLAGGAAADTFHQDIFKVCRHVDEGLLLDLSSRVKADNIDLEKDYYLFGTEIWEGGKVLAMPYQCGPRSYYYNQYVLAEVGIADPWKAQNGKWNLSDLREWCKKVTRDKTGDGKLDVWGLLWGVNSGSEYGWGSLVHSFGGRWADLDAGKYTLDEPKTIEAFKLIYDMYMQDKSVLPPMEAKALADAGITSPDCAGVVAFWEDTAGRMGDNRLNNKGVWDLLPEPSPDRNKPGIAVQSASPNSAWVKTPHPDEAYEVIKFLAGSIMQTLMGSNQLIMPQLKEAAKDPNGFLRKPPEHVMVMLEAMERFVPYFLHWNTLDVDPVIGKELELAFLGQKPLEQALKDANREANKLVKIGTKPSRPKGFVG